MTGDQETLPGQDAPQCAYCAHVTKMGTLDGKGWTCEAFPGGVPESIVQGIDSHEIPFPGDRGIRFQLASPNHEGR